MVPFLMLKMALLERREPQYALAARIGMSESQLSRIVRGRRVATPAERARIAQALGVSEQELFPLATTGDLRPAGPKRDRR